MSLAKDVHTSDDATALVAAGFQSKITTTTVNSNDNKAAAQDNGIALAAGARLGDNIGRDHIVNTTYESSFTDNELAVIKEVSSSLGTNYEKSLEAAQQSLDAAKHVFDAKNAEINPLIPMINAAKWPVVFISAFFAFIKLVAVFSGGKK